MKCSVEVQNVPKTVDKKYIVARYTVFDNMLWYWGAFDDLATAKKTASEVEGVVCINE